MTDRLTHLTGLAGPTPSPQPSPTRGEGVDGVLPLPLWERVGVRGKEPHDD